MGQAEGPERAVMMRRTDDPERAELLVPLGRVASSSSRRTRLALAVWTIGLGAIAWIGLSWHDQVTAPPIQIAAVPTAGQVMAVPAAAPEPPRRAVPPPVQRHTFGEDGLMGGLAFGTNIPRLSQADIERDGYRYYGQLLARDLERARQGSLSPMSPQ
jgi:hypothetical protein